MAHGGKLLPRYLCNYEDKIITNVHGVCRRRSPR